MEILTNLSKIFLNSRICCTTIANGKTGEIPFARHELTHRDRLKQQAVSEVNNEEILEWYRQQYNIPLAKFRTIELDLDDVIIDFYRRQYWNEIRFGIRQWNDDSIDTKMPPFTLYRSSGGALPVPNGYNFQNEYTVKVDAYTNAASSSGNSALKSSLSNTEGGSSGMNQDQKSDYKISEDDFAKLVKAAETDDSMWETIESLEDDTNG